MRNLLRILIYWTFALATVQAQAEQISRVEFDRTISQFCEAEYQQAITAQQKWIAGKPSGVDASKHTPEYMVEEFYSSSDPWSVLKCSGINKAIKMYKETLRYWKVEVKGVMNSWEYMAGTSEFQLCVATAIQRRCKASSVKHTVTPHTPATSDGACAKITIVNGKKICDE